MCKPNKTLTALGDPLGAVIAKNASPGLAQIAAPLALVQKNAADGKPVTIRNINDPGNLFTKSQAQKDKEAWAAGAGQRAADAALNDANTSLASLRARRRAGSALSIGASGGDAPLSSVLAYGKSTFG